MKLQTLQRANGPTGGAESMSRNERENTHAHTHTHTSDVHVVSQLSITVAVGRKEAASWAELEPPAAKDTSWSPLAVSQPPLPVFTGWLMTPTWSLPPVFCGLFSPLHPVFITCEQLIRSLIKASPSSLRPAPQISRGRCSALWRSVWTFLVPGTHFCYFLFFTPVPCWAFSPTEAMLCVLCATVR